MNLTAKIFFICVVVFSFAFLPPPSFQRTPDGVIVRLKNAQGNTRQLKLQVINEKIMKVTASPSDSFSTFKSLMALPQPVYSSFTVVEKKGKVRLSTPALAAEVSLLSGEITFLDPAGKILLREKEGGGKNFIATNVDNENAYKISQVFESPDDEAFYGLGGHQNGQMNYKGEDVELVQHNIVDVVPFVYSSKNYGLLWDNYSISRFGDQRPFEPLSTVQLFSRDGRPGGLTADYYVGDKIVDSKIEDKINYEYLETPEVDNFPKEVAQKGKVVWEGSFTSEVEGDHKFLVYSSGYVKVWIDGKLVIDKWRQNWNPWTNKFNVPVAKKEKHTIRIEWTGEGGFMAVKHLDPLPADEQARLTLSSEVADEIVYYFVKGDNADDVISGYRKLTGKAPIPPSWALGFWQSRERYRNQSELIGVVEEYRKRNIPIDNIVLDWQYWEDPQWGSHEFDRSRFPDPEGMVKTLHALNANLMISVWPKFNLGTKNYEEMNQKGFLFTNNIKKKRIDWVGVGYQSTFYDPFNPEAGDLFWNQIDAKLNRIGIDAWWLDATEPDMHSNLSIDERIRNMSPTAMGPGARYFNAYSLLNSKSVYEGQRRSSPDKRVFILTRSAYGGQQRYGAVTWSGDIVSRWSDFRDQVGTGINFCLSGIPYWTMDIGGFAVESKYYNASGETLEEWRELNTRWFQFGTFCPVFRSHGQYPFREIYNISPEGHPAYGSMVYYDKLRYQLMPYIYSLAGQTYFNNYTLMRGLVMDFPNDKNVRDITDQYMFGPSVLVSPVVEPKVTTRSVYLPAGTGWYDLYSGNYMKGGTAIKADAPYERMPLYAKEGSIIPTGVEIQYTNEKPSDAITLFVYTGKDADFLLYEDEGRNYNYEQGQYSMIPLHYDERSGELTVGDRKGSFKGMSATKKFSIVWVSAEKPVGMSLDAHPDQVLDYSGKQTSAKRK
jgi:alpha-D-xyloside xylohydrolase